MRSDKEGRGASGKRGHAAGVCRWAMCGLVLALGLGGPGASSGHAQSAAPADAASLEGTSGLAVPRFVSLKSDRVNVRRGPGRDYPIAWVFRRIGLPVEIVREYGHWRKIRDSVGATGWVYRGLLGARRTALIAPWPTKPGANGAVVADTTKAFALRDQKSTSSRVIVFAESGTIASVTECDGRWCRVFADPYHGWIEQKKLWGIYKTERIK